MTTSDMLLRTSPPVRQVASTHVFKIGDTVLMKPSFLYASGAGVYRITATLPWADGQPQYRIRNEDERYERVAPQDSLERVSPSSPDAKRATGRAGLIKKTFSRG